MCTNTDPHANAQPFARRHTGCQDHCTSLGLPTPVRMLVAGSIWAPAAAVSGTLVTFRPLGMEVHLKDPNPSSQQLSSLSPLCPGSGAQMRWMCLHMKQQRVCDFQGPHLCPSSPPALCFEPKLQEDVITAKLRTGLSAG